MTTATKAPRKFTCGIYRNATIINVYGSEKTLHIDLQRAFEADLTDAEALLLNQIQDSGTANVRYNVELTYDEMRLVLSIKAKADAVCPNGFEHHKAPVAVDNPAQPKPSIAARVMQETNHVTHQGIKYNRRPVPYGQDAEETAINRAVNIHSACNEQQYLLQYDIPDAAGIPNPSWQLWHHGFRMTKSCWVLPESHMNHPTIERLIREWKAGGSKVRIVPFSDSAKAQIKDMAAEELAEELRRQHNSLLERLDSAEKAYQKALAAFADTEGQGGEVTDKQRLNAERAKDNTKRALLRECEKHFKAALASAELYDVTGNVQDLLMAQREAVKANTAAFNEEMRAKGSKQV